MFESIFKTNARAIFLVVFYVFVSHLFAQEDLAKPNQDQKKPKRAALIIGNGDYSGTPLRHPPNDAIYLAELTKELGFKTEVYTNLNHQEMIVAIDLFEENISDSLEVAFVFYSGHGMHDKSTGENYLLPVKAKIVKKQDIESEAVNVNHLFNALSKNRGINFLVFDACYKNVQIPEGASGCLYLNSDIPPGTLLILSHIPGSVACECYSTPFFNQELIKALKIKGLDISVIEKTIRKNVFKISETRQSPWSISNYTGTCILNMN